MKKILVITLALALVVAISVGGTMAYLTSKDAVVNTFTVGNVKIDLEETETDDMGNALWTRTQTGNKYKLIPGHDYTKLPWLYVMPGSEPSFVRYRITINNVSELKAIVAAHPELQNPDGSTNYAMFIDPITEAYEGTNWAAQSTVYDEANNTATTDYWYTNEVNGDVNIPVPGVGKNDYKELLVSLMGNVKVPACVTGEELATLNDFKMDIEAHAIQADGFYTPDNGYNHPDNSHAAADAWAAFDGQVK